MNTSLCSEADFRPFIHSEYEQYLEFNQTPDVSPAVLWKGAKAVLRGCIISYASAIMQKKKDDRDWKPCINSNNLSQLRGP